MPKPIYLTQADPRLSPQNRATLAYWDQYILAQPDRTEITVWTDDLARLRKDLRVSGTTPVYYRDRLLTTNLESAR